jgi:hypothetical protein
MFSRRNFLRSSLALAALDTIPAKVLYVAAPVSKVLPAWKLGVLEIHHIATNRGNSALLRGLGMGVNTSERLHDWVKPTEEKDALMLAYPGDPVWGAVFVTVGKPRDSDRPGLDYSAFRTLQIEMRGENGDEAVDIGIKDSTQPDNGTEARVPVKLTRAWQPYQIAVYRFAGFAALPPGIRWPIEHDPPLFPTDLHHLYVVCEFVFGVKPETVYVRQVRYLK